jgi:DNA-binding response OmpR family regulator
MAGHFALIVEDTPDMAGIMEMVLDRMGIEHHHCLNGREALAFLETRTPDILLLDIGLPEMSGWRVLEAIQERFQTVAYPVLVLTAFDDPANRVMGRLQEAVFRYITKPFAPSTLTEAVRDALKLDTG